MLPPQFGKRRGLGGSVTAAEVRSKCQNLEERPDRTKKVRGAAPLRHLRHAEAGGVRGRMNALAFSSEAEVDVDGI